MVKKRCVRLLPAPECWFVWGWQPCPGTERVLPLLSSPGSFSAPEARLVLLFCARKVRFPLRKAVGDGDGVGDGGTLLCGFMLGSADVGSARCWLYCDGRQCFSPAFAVGGDSTWIVSSCLWLVGSKACLHKASTSLELAEHAENEDSMP